MTTAVASKSNRGLPIWKIAFASCLGSVIEWYDFFIYGTFAGLVFNKVFFPSYNHLIGTMLAYGTFAVGFLSRPIGGIVFGHFGDKIGRKSMLILTLLIMGVATALIGLLPGYDSWGIMSPILLIVLRFLQGLGLGGEWGGATLLTVEHASEKKVGWYGAWPSVGAPAGLCLGTFAAWLLSSVLSNAQFIAWGWRLAFIVSFVICIIGLYVRLHILETPAFARIKEEKKQVLFPIADVFKQFGKNTICGMLTRWIEGLSFNIYAVFIYTYVVGILKVPRTDVFGAVTISALVWCVLIFAWAKLADRYGRRKIFLTGTTLMAVAIFPTFWMFTTWPESRLVLYIGLIFSLGVAFSAIWAAEPVLFSEIYPPEVRYSGMSFVYQMSGIYASGLAPLFCTYLLIQNGNKPWLVCGYVFVVAIISFFSTSFLTLYQLGEKETNSEKVVPQPGASSIGNPAV